jgi:hypothetical protein
MGSIRSLARYLAVSLFALTVSTLAAAQGWEIVRAEYGVSGRTADVTRRVRSLVRSGDDRLKVNNTNMGGDPAPGRHKTLWIRARRGYGQTREFSYREEDYMDTSMFSSEGYGRYGHDHDGDHHGHHHDNDGDDYGRDRDYDRDHDRDYGYSGRGGDAELQIVRAWYGVQGRSADVTARLESNIRDGRLSMHINNDTMGVGDPAPKIRKEVWVKYRYRGREYTKSVRESGDLRIP